ncbi:Hypothetical protein HVPorG_04984 [Roseomonas mucosa]|nr:Hypothetical protein HVPorG_04984 [Roseomonas mucosa]
MFPRRRRRGEASAMPPGRVPRPALRCPPGKGAAFPPDPLSARTLRALDPMSWGPLMPDRAESMALRRLMTPPARTRCFSVRAPRLSPDPGDQATG